MPEFVCLVMNQSCHFFLSDMRQYSFGSLCSPQLLRPPASILPFASPRLFDASIWGSQAKNLSPHSLHRIGHRPMSGSGKSDQRSRDVLIRRLPQ
jgi:hypothetical protein